MIYFPIFPLESLMSLTDVHSSMISCFVIIGEQRGISRWLRFQLPSDYFKVEKVLKGSLDSIPSPICSENSNMGGKICLRGKGKTLLGVVNKLLKQKDC